MLVPADSPDPQATYELLRREAALYGPELAAKPHVVVLTKMDLLAPRTPHPTLRTDEGAPVLAVSAVTREGLPDLLESLWRTLQSAVVTK